MNHSLILTVSETIHAPATDIWEALTDKKIIKEYLFGTEVETEWKVGGPVFFRGSWEGNTYEDKGTVLEVEKEKLLSYNYWSSMSGIEDKPENYATITYELEPDGKTTILRIIQKGFKNEEAYAHSSQNWASVLKDIKKLVEG